MRYLTPFEGFVMRRFKMTDEEYQWIERMLPENSDDPERTAKEYLRFVTGM